MKAKVVGTWHVGYQELVGKTGKVVGVPFVSDLSAEYDGIIVEFEDGRQFMFMRDELEFLPEDEEDLAQTPGDVQPHAAGQGGDCGCETFTSADSGAG